MPPRVRLVIPPELGAVARVPNTVFVTAPRWDVATKREVVARYERTRSDFPTLAAFAEAERKQLAWRGLNVTATSIAAMVKYYEGRTPKLSREQRLLALLRARNIRTGDWWFDFGDIAVGLGIPRENHVQQVMRQARKTGHVLRKRPASWADQTARGWRYEFRLWESKSGGR